MSSTILFHTEGFSPREYLTGLVERKAEKLLRHHASILRVRLHVVRDTPHGRSENFAASARVERAGADLHAHASASEPEAAIAQSIDKLERQLVSLSGERKHAQHHPQPPEFPVDLPKV